MKQVENDVKGLVALDDSLKGEGGQAIRSFYLTLSVLLEIGIEKNPNIPNILFSKSPGNVADIPKI